MNVIQKVATLRAIRKRTNKFSLLKGVNKDVLDQIKRETDALDWACLRLTRQYLLPYSIIVGRQEYVAAITGGDTTVVAREAHLAIKVGHIKIANNTLIDYDYEGVIIDKCVQSRDGLTIHVYVAFNADTFDTLKKCGLDLYDALVQSGDKTKEEVQ